jgi:hypothetical protein
MYNFDMLSNAAIDARTDAPRPTYVIIDNNDLDYNRSDDMVWLQAQCARLQEQNPELSFWVIQLTEDEA